MSKRLLSGLSLTGLSSGLIFYEKEYGVLSIKEKEIDNSVEGEEDSKTLIEKAGLRCEGQYCWPNRWSKRNFNVEKNKKNENLVFDYWTEGKLRKHENSEGYLGGLRFTVEGSDIQLYARKSWIKKSIPPLEEFENYEIKKEGKKYYLSRTKNSNEGKILELGLPDSCTLPGTGDITCSILHVEEVKFGGGLEGQVDSETSLTITKTEDKSFRDGYKFTFTFPRDVTIGGKVIKAKSPTDFRMKKHKNGHLTLERAWENVNDLLDRVGLVCGENGNCSLKSGETLKIKKAEGQELLEISTISPGRIRFYKNDDDYFNGLRLEVDGEKITSGDNTLEEFETYEIEEEGDKYFLLLKKNSEERIKELLKYPCPLSSTSECSISNERSLKAISFEGKDTDSISLQEGQTVNITVSKAPEEDFPVGWKFTVTSTGDLNISSSNSVKANAPTDFKLKRHDDENLTLERAWANENDLAGKVGLSCDGDGNCSLKTNESLRIKKEDKEFQISSLAQETEGKIKLHKENAGYSNGLKFTIESGKIESGDNVLEEFETYEIKEIEGKYYLVLITSAEKRIKELLKFPSRCSDSSECSISSEDEFKAINFAGKDDSSMSLQHGKTVKITVSKAPEGDFTLGRKFTVTSSGDLNISSSTTVSANAPTDFKLKRIGDGNLTLEKAWSNENDLVGKVGLNCGEDNNCTIKNEPIKVKKGGKDLQISSLDKGGKIKLYKGSSGYSNGLKFEIEEKNIVSGDDTLEEFETYEISEDTERYYLGRKTSAEEKINKLLNFPGRCYSKHTCENLSGDEFKNINFKNKEMNSISLPRGQTIKITISEAPVADFPLGRKITVTSPAALRISSSASLKANTPAEFKIEKGGSGQETTLSLEKLWTLETLTRKVGLSCNNNICTITPNSLNVKRGDKLLTKASEKNPQTPSVGKIKLIEEQANYNEGFKFQIQDGNINLSTSSGQTGILEEFETYEIKNDGKNHYLERKKTSKEGKWEALGLPTQCLKYYDNSQHGCPISFSDLGNIKFFGKKPNGTITVGNAGYWLKTFSDSSLPKGIRVKMEVNKNREVKIPKETGGSIILWKGYETEFKIKDEGDGNYSLENVVNVNDLVKQFGIMDGNCDDVEGCTVGSKINIYMEGQEYRRDADVSAEDRTKKITYRYMKEKGFSDNLVFRVPDKGIELSGFGGDALTKNAGRFNRIKAGTYVIKKYAMGRNDNDHDDVPYLAREYAQNYDPGDKFFDYEN